MTGSTEGLRILVTNDDGVNSPGIIALARSMAKLGEVVVVAPDRERSAIGHGLTFFHPVRLRSMGLADGISFYNTDGTPTDCVVLGLRHVMKGRVDLLVSGINRGANMGDDITYSGTVAAAMEGAINRIPSMAVSLASYTREDYDTAAYFARLVAGDLLQNPLPDGVFLNVNVPDLPLEEIAGIRATSQGRTRYSQQVDHRRDPWGGEYFWIWGHPPQGVPGEGTDFEAVKNRYVSVTPLHLSMTREEYLDSLRNWNVVKNHRREDSP